MSDLKHETLLALCVAYKVRGFFSGGDDLAGIRHKGRILWFRWDDGSYRQTGSTDTPQGAKYRRV